MNRYRARYLIHTTSDESVVEESEFELNNYNGLADAGAMNAANYIRADMAQRLETTVTLISVERIAPEKKGIY